MANQIVFYPLDPNLVAWWRLNEESGSVFKDSSGKSVDLTLNNTSGAWGTLPIKSVSAYDFASGQIGQASAYNSKLDFGTSDPWSCSAWVNIPVGKSGGAVAGNLDYTGNYNGWVFYASNSSAPNEVQIQIVDNPSSQIAVVSNTAGSIALGTTYFVTGTYDGSGVASGVKLYINGVQVPVTVSQDNLAGGSNSTQPVGIGSIAAGGGESLVGFLSDVRVFNKALTALQVASLSRTGPF
jgi:hypothetical protein